ncbi:hypothetical protein CBOM_06423 [Ceraceosorus bombacis]|uniref:Uncharacterized protein n=1 Tax=Ceraceosorus bombacis TaxID=401625 RepID=A0A0N7LAG0_9BASI|nr:hypothetical protein CBOM_06423 [Ceraceosorus bombacis]
MTTYEMQVINAAIAASAASRHTHTRVLPANWDIEGILGRGRVVLLLGIEIVLYIHGWAGMPASQRWSERPSRSRSCRQGHADQSSRLELRNELGWSDRHISSGGSISSTVTPSFDRSDRVVYSQE